MYKAQEIQTWETAILTLGMPNNQLLLQILMEISIIQKTAAQAMLKQLLTNIGIRR